MNFIEFIQMVIVTIIILVIIDGIGGCIEGLYHKKEVYVS